MTAFIFIFLFALVFVCSFMLGIQRRGWGMAVNVAAQVGMGVSILVFLLLPGKKKVH